MKKPAQDLIAEVPRRHPRVGLTIGIDLGDIWSHYCTLNQDGEVIDRGRFRTKAKAIEKWFKDLPSTRVAMEAGVHSIWISEQLQALGHEVIVANVRELRAISHSDRKSDDVDAEKLARYARLDPEILRPISHRTVEQQEALTLIRARELLVRLRTAAVNAVRGLTKACGHRMPASSTKCFAQRGQAAMPPGLKLALGPILAQIAEMTLKIKQYDREIQRMTQTEYTETQSMMTIHGVGHITALTFVLTLGDKTRFHRSRDVGCYLGLRPKRSQSGERDPQLGITKAGNAYLRSLLIECANHILRPHGRDSALRQWGLHLAARGGKQAKNKSVVAVARKLAVLLHHLWTTQEPYIPFYQQAA
ncbi:IS110 family transposase [Acidicapsa dinghuensis]|uniref:IS110 family transposase n=1 Tax=Acidicapsa dinghuensis TaxID=2218256 RepID=A0ABW1EC86_9BACT|nr:IS110 family transposase [Acidicapsa dinghuensis]